MSTTFLVMLGMWVIGFLVAAAAPAAIFANRDCLSAWMLGGGITVACVGFGGVAARIFPLGVTAFFVIVCVVGLPVMWWWLWRYWDLLGHRAPKC